ncbi:MULTISPECIES: helix-turn-helix domain-containing protein [Pseudomonas]|uniref:helix-turn-helix domain-containing protein n=1 Tax=Pseudomonas TaxID=286 RepID=UPI00057DA852|nr:MULTISPECIES: helix-turn-helix domain-containing protein [Pseudomonas]KIC83883.1 DNA-binding protein [Pseudomonas sp. C5pp]MEE1901381.1 helix-turn-helix domain-containing protein [Pseudomonas inefficax]MEE1983273.1 helix-turn-helix domain-containing protein [Pseudomonas inefficax]
MSLRHSLAAVLQQLRVRQGLSQQDLSGPLLQQTVHTVEAATTTATIDTLTDLATALKVSPTSLFAMVIAAESQVTTRQVLQQALDEVEGLGRADDLLERLPREIEHPRVTASREKWKAVQSLKKDGLTPPEVARALGYSRSTVWRLWEREPGR